MLLSESAPGIDAFFGGDGIDQVSVFDAFGSGLTRVAFNHLVLNAAASVEYFTLEDASIALTGTGGDDLIDLSGTTALTNFGSYVASIRFNLLDGNDRYYGSSGDGNNVDGGAGDDWLYGGNGSDTLIGGSGNDSMVGGEGSDVYEINSSGDVIVETGRYGIDTLIVTARTWTLAAPFEGLKAEGKGGLIGIGNNKGNYLTGGAGDDSRSGLAGRDYMTGAGQDTLLGGTGSDIYYVTDHSVTIVELAKEGIDTIVTEAASWTLTGAVENLSLIGDADAVGIGSASGNVMVANGTGNETLQGMGGNDTLVGYRGGARLEGGTGNDTYSVGVLGGQIVELAHEGVDRVDVYFGIGVDPMTFPTISAYILPDFIEQLYLHPQLEMGSNDQDRPVTGTGNASNNRIVAGNGNDTLYGLDGNDTLLGGSDELGASSNDGNDSLIGGNGDDTYLLRFYAVAGSATVADTVVEAADGGFDTIEVIANYLSLIGYANVEALTNIYYSGGGAHKLGCVVEGNSLDNVLTTGIGEDRLNGGDGHDTLSGGAGNDQFRFSAAFGQSNFITESSDTITDFTHAADKIMLNSLTFSNLGFGPVANAAFKVISGGGVVDGSDRLLYNQTTGQLFYDRDGNGAGEAWLLAVFSNHTVLTASDFSAGFQGQDS